MKGIGEIVIQVDNNTNRDFCCLCLMDFRMGTCNNIRFSCCKQLIHKQCFFLIIMNRHKECPLCRQSVNVLDYFDETALTMHYEMMSIKDQEEYYNVYNELQYEISKLDCTCGRLHRIKRLLISNLSTNLKRFIRMNIFWLFIFLYISLFFLLLSEHIHHSTQQR